MKKIVCIGTKDIYGSYGRVYCKISIEDGKLSISGVEGPLASGNAKGGCGQIQDHLHPIKTFEPGWSIKLLDEFIRIWNAWHLNDMNAGCEHQRAEGWGDEKISVVKVHNQSIKAIGHADYDLISYGLKEIDKRVEKAKRLGKVLPMRPNTSTPTSKSIFNYSGHQEYYKAHAHAMRGEVYEPGKAMSSWFGENKPIRIEVISEKYTGHVYESEHPKGVLAKPCPICGYKYGTAWLKEELPAEVISFLESLPDSEYKPAWV